jgi:hypothetical protein
MNTNVNTNIQSGFNNFGKGTNFGSAVDDPFAEI